MFTSFLTIKVQLLQLFSCIFSVFFLKIYPPGSGSMQIWIRIHSPCYNIVEALPKLPYSEAPPKLLYLYTSMLESSRLILVCGGEYIDAIKYSTC